MTNLLLTFGIICFIIAVIGQAKLFFLEINPGCFGRFIALTTAIFSFALAVIFILFPLSTPDLVSNYLTPYISQFMEQFLGMIFYH